jgi:hypothetical protein
MLTVPILASHGCLPVHGKCFYCHWFVFRSNDDNFFSRVNQPLRVVHSVLDAITFMILALLDLSHLGSLTVMYHFLASKLT